jgi:hypothetical protein
VIEFAIMIWVAFVGYVLTVAYLTSWAGNQ